MYIQTHAHVSHESEIYKKPHKHAVTRKKVHENA